MEPILLVGGTWDDEGGRPSKIVSAMQSVLQGTCHNGGHFADLVRIRETIPSEGETVWMANVPNDKEKIVADIKAQSPKTILATSKRNVDGKYGLMELIAHALKIKSNLFIEFSRDNPDGRLRGRLLDPLGNLWCDSTDFLQVAHALKKRLQQLGRFSRIGSRQAGAAMDVPDEAKFFGTVRGLADTFHALMHGASPERFLGNASFRCERGFPSFRAHDHVFVSRRDIDKRYIGREGFVAVDPASTETVLYYGDKKPSVDAPIQVRLYQHYPEVRYMVHSHVYAKDGLFTKRAIPCGAIEEFDEIKALFPERGTCRATINLLGHGSLVMSDDVEFVPHYYARKMPEPQAE